MTNLWPNGLLYVMPASRKNLSGMVRFDRYNLPHDALTFSNGSIGKMEHLMLKLDTPDGGGSTAINGALDIDYSNSFLSPAIEFLNKKRKIAIYRLSLIHLMTFKSVIGFGTANMMRSHDGNSSIVMVMVLPVALNSSASR